MVLTVLVSHGARVRVLCSSTFHCCASFAQTAAAHARTHESPPRRPEDRPHAARRTREEEHQETTHMSTRRRGRRRASGTHTAYSTPLLCCHQKQGLRVQITPRYTVRMKTRTPSRHVRFPSHAHRGSRRVLTPLSASAFTPNLSRAPRHFR